MIENGPVKIFDDIFRKDEIEKMDNWFAGFTSWGLGYDMQEYGASSATLCRSLQWDMWKGIFHILEDTHMLARNRFKSQYDIDIPYFQRCLINNFKFGDSPMFHKDAPSNDKALTMMVYPNSTWDINWGGYTAFADEDDNALWIVNPKPGRVVLFPGNLNHAGVAPTKVHKGYGRFSMAYQDASEKAPVMDPADLTPSRPEDIKKASMEEYYGEDYKERWSILERNKTGTEDYK